VQKREKSLQEEGSRVVSGRRDNPGEINVAPYPAKAGKRIKKRKDV